MQVVILNNCRRKHNQIVSNFILVGNGYPIWTLSFCKNICGNEELLGEIIQEAAGLLRGGVMTTYEMMLGRWIYGPESQEEEAVNINRQQEEEEETATNINKEIDGPEGLQNQGDTEEGTKVIAVENIKPSQRKD